MRNIILLLLTIQIPFLGMAQTGLTLEKCRELALSHNIKIAEAKLKSDAAISIRKAAFTQFLPNFNIVGSYTYLNKNIQLLEEDLLFPVIPYSVIGSDGKVNSSLLGSESIVINPQTGNPIMDEGGNPVFKNYGWIPKDEVSVDNKSIYLVNAGFSQPVYTGGKVKENYKITTYAEESAKSNEQLTVAEVLYKVETYYWQAVTLKEKQTLAQTYLKMLQALVIDLENYYQEGLITKNDLLKARVKENEARMLLLKVNNGLALSKMALFQQIGLPLHSQIKIEDATLLEMNIIDWGSDDLSYDLRPELNLLNQGVKIAESGVKLMKSRYLPDIALTAGYLISNPNPYNGFSKEFGGSMALGVVCKIPVFHWGDKKHTLNAAKAGLKISTLKLDEANEMISLEVQQSSYQFNESLKMVEAAEMTLTQATENLNVVRSSFDEGIVKTTEMLESQALWQQAKSSVIEAKSAYMLNKTLLKKVTGQLK